MNVFRCCIISFYLIFSFISSSAHSALVQVNGRWSTEKYAPVLPVPEHFDLASKLLHENNWGEALQNYMVIITHFPQSPFYADSLFNSGVCYFFLGDFDVANKQFEKYLNLGGTLKHFEKVFEFKFYIAEYYSKGSKKHLFGFKQLPKLMPAKTDALALYDEVIASLPSREIAAQALFGKASCLRSRREYKEGIEALQTITRRFPKNSLAADAFLLISDIYLEESRLESQNPDLIALAQINVGRFKKSFPGEERIQQSEENLVKMQEVFARSLYTTGRFYERKKKPHASRIYYTEAIKRYPETDSATKSRQRLAQLAKEVTQPRVIAKK